MFELLYLRDLEPVSQLQRDLSEEFCDFQLSYSFYPLCRIEFVFSLIHSSQSVQLLIILFSVIALHPTTLLKVFLCLCFFC